ncbi:MAG: ParA family protein [Alphaproteobacteria bacterium]
MKTLVIASQKGGVAKTTLTTELAYAATASGLATAIIDTDPQATSCFWGEARGQGDIAISPVFPALLDSRLKALEMTGCDLAIIDTPAVSKDTASAAIRHADFVLVPARPSAFDLKSMLETIEQAVSLKKPYAIVITMCPAQHGPEVNTTIERMATLHHEICPVLIHHYVAYPRAQKHGLATQEIDPDCKAAAEIQLLYAYTLKRLGLSKNRRKFA